MYPIWNNPNLGRTFKPLEAADLKAALLELGYTEAEVATIEADSKRVSDYMMSRMRKMHPTKPE